MWLVETRISSCVAWQQCLHHILNCLNLQLLLPKARAWYRKRCEHAASLCRSYRLCDVDVDHSCRAEGRRASVPGLDHQRPLAVLLLGDVLHDLHGLDVRLQKDLTSVGVDIKRVVRIGCHDGVLDDVVRRLRVLVHCLQERSRKHNMFE